MNLRNSIYLASLYTIGLLGVNMLSDYPSSRYFVLLSIAIIAFLVLTKRARWQGKTLRSSFYNNVVNGLTVTGIAALITAVMNILVASYNPNWSFAHYTNQDMTDYAGVITGTGAVLFELIVISIIGLLIALQLNKKSIT